MTESLADRFAELHPALSPDEALVEANRCLFCYDAPCTFACPTHIDVPRFIKKISTGNLRGSAASILDANVLGLSCSRVCPVDVLCQGACVLHRYGKSPIEIGRLQRHAMDHFYARGAALPVGEPKPGKVACIGAGPASLACAAELRRRGHAVTVFDRRELPGGLNTYGVAQYKLKPADSRKETELLRQAGVEFRLNADVGVDVSIEWIEAQFDAVFVGCGLGPTQTLGVNGENLPGVVDALTFIARYKTGDPISGRNVAVVGGGNTAIDAAVAAKLLGADEVRMLYRRSEDRVSAFAFELKHARHNGVVFEWNVRPVAIHGESRVEWIECEREGESLRVDCDLAIVSIGQSKLIDLLARCRDVTVDRGRVVANPETGQTANPRYFAGGDCVNGGREVVDAVAEGKRAAVGIAEWLGTHGRT